MSGDFLPKLLCCETPVHLARREGGAPCESFDARFFERGTAEKVRTAERFLFEHRGTDVGPGN
jgi:hypothetical protein